MSDPERPRPNILLICTDQHRWDVLSPYGNRAAITPNLERLAGQGVLFEHAFTPSPVCSPARASLITGRYPHAHGLWANGVTLPERETMASKALADAGYHCGLVGKLHLSACFEGRTERRLDDGFAFRRWAHDPFHGSPENAYHAWLRSKHPALWERANRDLVTPGADYHHDAGLFDRMPTEAHYSTWVAEETAGFLRGQQAGEPFFLWVNFYDPHHPFVAPDEYLAKYPPGSVPPPIGSLDELAGKPAMETEAAHESYAGHAAGFTEYTAEEIDEIRRAYYAMVTLIDDKVGEILAELEAQGLAEDTLVIFAGDHGEMLGDHALLLKGPMLYDDATRVPLMMRWPGVLPAGVRRPELASLHDLAPTMLRAAGLEPLRGNQGVDLVDVVRGDAQAREWALTEYRDSGHPYDPPVFTSMLRGRRHKIVVWHGGAATGRAREGELYDLENDPRELVNLWDSPAHREIREAMLAELLDVFVSLEDRSAPREAAW